MCELYAMSTVSAKSISFSLYEFRRHGGDTGTHCDGWGLAFFDGGSVEIHREPKPAALSLKMDHVLQHQNPSDLIISHIRSATQGKISLQNTQPFSMQLYDKNHVFVHNGNLVNVQQQIPLKKYFPKGETDSEHAFCYLMERIKPLWDKRIPTLRQRTDVVQRAFKFFSQLGQANFIYTDGEYLFAFANERTQSSGKIAPPGLHYLARDAHFDPLKTKIAGFDIISSGHEQLLLASVPLTDENWIPLEREQLIVVKSGNIVYSSQ